MSDHGKVSISIVSHGQGSLVKNLLTDLDNCYASILEVILTVNVTEDLPFEIAKFRFPIKVVVNRMPKGFAANHNAAFELAKAKYFSVLNPDIRFERDPFPWLFEQICEQVVGVAAPLIVNLAGGIENSGRRFPTPASIFRKALFGDLGPDYRIEGDKIFPDWVGGMFMMFRSEVFRSVGGFDEHYFLYYEDVDLCWRLRRRGYQVVLLPSVRAIHHARRESHHNLRYWVWHMNSMLRFFLKRATTSGP
jgi:N-acetylglucosaminyl-diphospho-decaprenol L-rhamnosyltransferase